MRSLTGNSGYILPERLALCDPAALPTLDAADHGWENRLPDAGGATTAPVAAKYHTGPRYIGPRTADPGITDPERSLKMPSRHTTHNPTIGSAQASAWLQAMGAEPLDEVILLPMEPKSIRSRERSHASTEPRILEANPNPSSGPIYIVCNVPEGVQQATVRITDMNGRVVHERNLIAGAGIVELDRQMAAAGIYVAELHLDGIRAGQVKLAVQ